MSYVPLLGVVLLLVIGVCWRSWLQRRRYGSWGIAVFRSLAPMPLVRDVFLLLLPVILLGEAWRLPSSPQAAAGRMLIAPWPLLGAGALFGGIALMVWAQLDLGASWRVGIDDGATPGLVRHGLYGVSRNPIFLALLICLIGFALLVPTWPSVLALAGSAIGIRRQVLEEEAYLRLTYGTDYLAYARRVGRFVPGMGQLR